tara:strand:- start:158 stop:445 length:288 start_codon:yes stop_codon:yes gene_type:complete
MQLLDQQHQVLEHQDLLVQLDILPVAVVELAVELTEVHHHKHIIQDQVEQVVEEQVEQMQILLPELQEQLTPEEEVVVVLKDQALIVEVQAVQES